MANFIDLEFANGEYRFQLNLPQIDEIQRACDAGILEIYGRILAGGFQAAESEILLNPAGGRARAEDLIETIRQGLIGGGYGTVNGQRVDVKPHDAERLIKNYVLDRPIMEWWELAFAIMGACVQGYEPPADEGKAEAASRKTASEDQDPAAA